MRKHNKFLGFILERNIIGKLIGKWENDLIVTGTYQNSCVLSTEQCCLFLWQCLYNFMVNSHFRTKMKSQLVIDEVFTLLAALKFTWVNFENFTSFILPHLPQFSKNKNGWQILAFTLVNLTKIYLGNNKKKFFYPRTPKIASTQKRVNSCGNGPPLYYRKKKKMSENTIFKKFHLWVLGETWKL